MSSSKKYIFILLGSLLVVLGLYFALVQSGLLNISERLAAIVAFTIGIVFCTGIPLVATSFGGDPEKFVGKFLVLTTVQLLLAMILMLAFVVSKIPAANVMCFHFIGLYIILLTVQSVALVKLVNSPKN